MSTYWNFEKPVYENKRYVADYAFTMPEDCSDYAQNNIENYNTITILPEKYLTADYSKITNAHNLFNGMAKCDFKSINFNFNNIQNADATFRETNISLIPNLNLDKCTTINSIFWSCPNLKVAELKNIKVSKKLANASNVLWNCINLKSVISVFDTSNCTLLGGFCSNCIALEELCYIDTRKNTDFHDFIASTKITGLDWEINLQCAQLVDGMFASCNNLLDGGITLINVPRTLDLSKIGITSSKYKVKNYIETALDPSEVVD